LEQQIDTSVTFVDLHAAPANYVGRVVKVSGVVIRAKWTKVQTEIEVLELPTDAEGPPTTVRLRSEGRFLAVREEFLDPASVPPGTPITVIGVVRGATTRPLDESEYTYPVVKIKHLIDWSVVQSHGPVYAEWVAVEKNYQPGKQTVYVDPDTIRREGNLVTLWQLVDFKWMQGKGAVINPYRFGRLNRFRLVPHGFFSTTTHKQFDCAENRVRLLAFTEFSHHMGTGRRNNGYVDQDNWLPVEPESVNHALWEVACGK
jgi:starvation-inducible outer membrane lipoprotein